MITQCFQLHDSTIEQNQTYGDVFKETLPAVDRTVYFGNKLRWNRTNVWKFVEYLGPEQAVEHICFVDKKENIILPLLSKYIFASTPYAYCQTYTHSINALLDRYASDSVMCTDGINNCIYDQVMESLKFNTPYMTDYMKEWRKSNMDIGYISPLKTCLQNNNTKEEVSIISHFTSIEDGIPAYNRFGTTFGEFYMQTTNMGYIKKNVEEISGNLENAFIDVKTGNNNERLLGELLIANFTPWKQIAFPNGILQNPNLGVNSQFITGEFTYDKFLNMVHPNTATAWVPSISDVSGIQGYMKHSSLYIPAYDKEFIALLEYIQSLALTDFCFKYKINELGLGIHEPVVIASQCRYFSHLSTPQDSLSSVSFLNTVLYDKDFLTELGDLLENWICISQPTIRDEFDTVKVIRTFNEELLFHFENSVYGNEEVMYYDLIGGSICGRNMCNLGWLGDKNIHYLSTAI